jgi:proto-oncogene tyrosine-protein kinase ROS
MGVTVYKKNVNTTSYTIQNLKANTEYVIKTAAYTSSGKGPWSSEFRGKTLKIPQDGKYASILWSAAEGLLKSDVTGENVEMLIHNTDLKVSTTNKVSAVLLLLFVVYLIMLSAAQTI